MRASALPTYPAESRPTDSESPMWTTDVHDVWGTGSELTGGGSDRVTPPSRGRAVVVGPERGASVVRGVVVRGREVVGVGVCPPPPLAARVVGGAGAAVGGGAWVVAGAGAGSGAAGAAGAGASIGVGAAAAALAVSAADAT